MKQLNLKLFFCLLSISGIAQNEEHVVLISIDGLRPEFYLSDKWPAPNIQQLRKKGAYSAGMISVFPALTYPAHVAMMTGALPARSGIAYNVKATGTGDWNWFTSDIKTPTLWTIFKERGMRTASVQWPVSVGNDIDINIPEIWNTKTPNDRISESRKHSTPGIIDEIELNATGKLDSSNMNEEFMGLDYNVGKIGAYIFTKYKPNLLTIHFASVDGRQHMHGMNHDSVRSALSNVDNSVGLLLEEIIRSGSADNTTIIIVGDHGFCDFTTVLRPNIWIKGINARFIASGGSAFLYLPEKKNENEILKSIIARIESLPSSQRSLFRIYYKELLTSKGVDSNAVVGLVANPGTIFSNSLTGEQFSKAKGGHHGYDPEYAEMKTGFIAYGTQIKKGALNKNICVTDIAPFIANLLDIKANFPDGILPTSILK